MIAAMIHHVLQHLPEHILSRPATEILVLDAALHAFRTQCRQNLAHLAFKSGPLLTRCRKVSHAIRLLKALRLLAAPSLQPNGLGIANMRDGVAYGTEAIAQRLRELFRRKLGDGLEEPVARPVVVVDKKAEVVVGHRIQFRRPTFAAVVAACRISRSSRVPGRHPLEILRTGSLPRTSYFVFFDGDNTTDASLVRTRKVNVS